MKDFLTSNDLLMINTVFQYEREIERLQKDVEHLKMKLEQAEQQRDQEQRDSPDLDSSERESTRDPHESTTPGQSDTNMKNIIAR